MKKPMAKIATKAKRLKKELIKGTKVELKEHKKVTKGKKSIAKQIAKDHVVGEKMPKYYEELDKMEEKAKKKGKK
jgi:hypothetical protein